MQSWAVEEPPTVPGDAHRVQVHDTSTGRLVAGS